ncbi:MAG: response regulator transcription factor [Prevotellaceae bacterium]|jgi:DNA-binding CsgD family transcriptional regulator|nr:response regulator transcription factor [Prevotellaceae bacterium]
MIPEFAIVEASTLACLGLKQLLEEIIPSAVIRTFPTYQALVEDTPDQYAHYFVSAQVYFEHTAFFLERHQRTIVLVSGASPRPLSGIAVLNTCQNEQELVKSILQLHQTGHRAHHRVAADIHDLTPRERQVLVLIVRGLLNKEVADRLHISLTTVISHRKNIMEKLGIRSVSGLTIYAVMHGYIDPDRI